MPKPIPPVSSPTSGWNSAATMANPSATKGRSRIPCHSAASAQTRPKTAGQPYGWRRKAAWPSWMLSTASTSTTAAREAAVSRPCMSRAAKAVTRATPTFWTSVSANMAPGSDRNPASCAHSHEK